MAISSASGSSALLPAGLGFRNVIINGGFDVWQRGTGSIAPSNGAITNADRWVHTGNTTTFTQQTDVPAGFRYSLGVSGSDPSFAQKIEAANSARLASQTVTFSIWAKSVSGSTSLFVNFYYPSAVDNFASLTTISSTTIATTVSSSWTRYALTVALPANVTNGLQVLVGRSAGASNTYFTGVQLEQNLQPTPFEQRPYGVELALCQRYYYRLGNTSVSGAYLVPSNNIVYSASAVEGCLQHPVPMRTSAVTLGSNSVYAYNVYQGNWVGIPRAAVSASNSTTHAVIITDRSGGTSWSTFVTGTTQMAFALVANTSAGYIEVSAEL